MANRDRLIAKGWKQGTVLRTIETLTRDARYDTDENDLLLIVSQTCDLVMDSLETEPYFEVICVRPLHRLPDGNYAGGKNARRLEFSYEFENIRTPNWSVVAHERHFVDRNLLQENVDPYDVIDDEQILHMLLRWLTKRYTRHAFPDTFVKRFRQKEDGFKKALKRLNPLISNIFIMLSPCFEDIDQEYGVNLILLMPSDNFDDAEKHSACSEIKNQIETLLNSCDGIYVEDINVESMADVSLEYIQGFLDWDYSYLSFRDIDPSPVPIEL